MDGNADSTVSSVGALSEQLAPASKIASQFGITRRTLSRWILDSALDFPVALEINKRLYFKQHEIDAWKISRARRSVDVKEAA